MVEVMLTLKFPANKGANTTSRRSKPSGGLASLVPKWRNLSATHLVSQRRHTNGPAPVGITCGKDKETPLGAKVLNLS